MIVTVWSPPSDASVDGLIMSTIVSGHLEVLYGGEKGAEEAVFEETYTLLNKIGVVDTKREFCRDWLNRGDSYFCCLKHNQKPPSVSAIVVCSSKLKHYS